MNDDLACTIRLSQYDSSVKADSYLITQTRDSSVEILGEMNETLYKL